MTTMQAATTSVFTDVGPYGEIYPPLLSTGYDPDEAIDELIRVNTELGGESVRRKRGAAYESQLTNALVFVHQKRIRAVLNGDPDALTGPVERALFREVTVEGRPVSVVPPSVEGLRFKTFAPVLRNLTPGRPAPGMKQTWQLGMKEHGKTRTMITDQPAKAVGESQRLYFEWCQREEQQIDASIEKLLLGSQPSLFHDFWHWQLDHTRNLDLGAGFTVRLLDRHNTVYFTTPSYPFLYDAERLRAVKILEMLRRESNVAMAWPSPETLLDWLHQAGALPDNQVQVEWGNTALGIPAQVSALDQKFTLVKRESRLVLFRMVGSQMAGKLAETPNAEPVTAWLTEKRASGRMAVVLWALWHGNVRQPASEPDEVELPEEEAE